MRHGFITRILIGFVILLSTGYAKAAEETFIGKVVDITIDYRGWYRISTDLANTQGCQSAKAIVYRSATDPVKSAILATLLAAKAADRNVAFTVNTCDATTGDAILWAVTMK